MGITRKHHAMRISGRGILAGRFTRNIDYNSDYYDDGSGGVPVTRISMREYIEDNNPSNWDREPPPGTAWKLGESFRFTCTAYGFGNSFGSSAVYFTTEAECVPYAYERDWIITAAEWEAMGSPTYGFRGPVTEGVYAGYVKRVAAISGTWIADTQWFTTIGYYVMEIRTDGSIHMGGANEWSHLDQRLEVGTYSIGW